MREGEGFGSGGGLVVRTTQLSGPGVLQTLGGCQSGPRVGEEVKVVSNSLYKDTRHLSNL